jgi:hypothetical protein
MLSRDIEKFYPIFSVFPENAESMDTLFQFFGYMYMLSPPPDVLLTGSLLRALYLWLSLWTELRSFHGLESPVSSQSRDFFHAETGISF